jgi:ABC-type transporter Mla maintaining outer membrane lipid asymmetry ATPase subunit MlaF
VDVAAGEVVRLVGDPSSGVVEAIEVLSGQRVPEAGLLQVEGRDVPGSGRRARQLWARVAVLGGPQGTPVGRRTVLESLADDVRRSETQPVRSVQPGHHERAVELLDAVGVPLDVRTRRERDVRGEDRARVRLARLLTQQPAVVVLPPGKPSAGLDPDEDPVGPGLVDSVLTRLRADAGSAVVRSSGQLPATLGDHERVVVLCGGRIVEVLGSEGLVHPLHPWTQSLAAGGEPIPTRPVASDPGCPFRGRCDRAQARCATEMPDLTPPLGATHPVACWFPQHPPRRGPVPGIEAGAVSPVPSTGHSDEPTAQEFVDC